MRWIAIHRNILDPFLYAAEYLLYRQFDFNFGSQDFRKETSRHENEFFNEGSLYYLKQTDLQFIQPDQKTIFFRGAEILKPSLTKEECIKNILHKYDVSYELFWVQDYFSKKMVYTSCSPDSLGNFFVKSNKPHELSRAFFKPEVLSKYKSDPNKFSLNGGHLTCRGGWMLRSCYINDANEVYSYICDIGSLPHQEQLYWKAYNIQKPIGESLSSADARDFRAEWVYIDKTKGILESTLSNFPAVDLKGKKILIWKSKHPDIHSAFNEIQTVITDSPKEFKDFIAALARLTIEGLKAPEIAEWTSKLGTPENELKKPNSKDWLGSIKLLHICLLKLVDKDCAGDIFNILSKLHKDKSKQTSHGGAKEPKGNLRKQAETILEEVTQVFVKLKVIINDYNYRIK